MERKQAQVKPALATDTVGEGCVRGPIPPAAPAEPSVPLILRGDVDACSFVSWGSLFEKQTIKSDVIPLDTEFLEYLEEDGCVLPRPSLPISREDPRWCLYGDDASSPGSDEDSDAAPARMFPVLEARIKQSIDKFGSVFVKLQWSSMQVSQGDAPIFLPHASLASPPPPGCCLDGTA
jgi:hypothetical protein